MMTTGIVSARSLFRHWTHKQGHIEVQTDWLALGQTVTRTKVLYTWLNTVYDSRSHQNTREQRTSGGNDEKMVARHKQTLFSSSRMSL